MMGGMEKTTVYLTTEQKRALARAAQAEDRSEARLIREGVDSVIARHRAAEPATPLAEDETSCPGDHVDDLVDRPRWMGRDEFVRRFVQAPADVALRSELRELAPGSTDEVELR